MIDIVDETLQAWRSGALIYGESDCMLSIGDYIARRGGKDVTGDFRGRYDTRAGALAQMAAWGGAAGLINATGIERIDGAPKRGDVVTVQCEGESIGAICTGDAIAARLERGMVEVGLRFVRIEGVWRCPL
jgi:hypothetical protein